MTNDTVAGNEENVFPTGSVGAQTQVRMRIVTVPQPWAHKVNDVVLTPKPMPVALPARNITCQTENKAGFTRERFADAGHKTQKGSALLARTRKLAGGRTNLTTPTVHTNASTLQGVAKTKPLPLP